MWFSLFIWRIDSRYPAPGNSHSETKHGIATTGCLSPSKHTRISKLPSPWPGSPLRNHCQCPQCLSTDGVEELCSLLSKGSFKAWYPWICLKSSHSRNYGPDDLSTEGQASQNLSKLQRDSTMCIVSAWVFYSFIPRIKPFFGWSPKISTCHLYRQILIITTDQMNVCQGIYCFHITRWKELPRLEAISEYKESIQWVSLRFPSRDMDAVQIPWKAVHCPSLSAV